MMLGVSERVTSRADRSQADHLTRLDLSGVFQQRLELSNRRRERRVPINCQAQRRFDLVGSVFFQLHVPKPFGWYLVLAFQKVRIGNLQVTEKMVDDVFAITSCCLSQALWRFAVHLLHCVGRQISSRLHLHPPQGLQGYCQHQPAFLFC